jgi:hypothetical protein
MLESVLFRWVDKVVEERRVAWIMDCLLYFADNLAPPPIVFFSAFWFVIFCCRAYWYHSFSKLIPLHMLLSFLSH